MFKVPYRNNSDIRQAAAAFLNQYHPSREIPIPIEDILELRMGVDLLVSPGIRQVLGADAYVGSGMSLIVIDEEAFHSGYPGRLIFTLAHELGHIVLHREIYEEFQVDSIKAFLIFRRTLDNENWGYLETQANKFASEIIYPSGVFENMVDMEIEKRGGRLIIDESDLAEIIGYISVSFGVSRDAARRQFDKTYPDVYQRILQSF